MPKPTFATLDPSRNPAPANPTFLRVHTPGSASPLRWTGNPHTSGFAALNTNLAALTPASYTAALARAHPPLPWPGWEGGLHTAHSVLDHILVRPADPLVPGTDAPDDASPWISTSQSLTWAVWEIARGLAPPPVPVDAFTVAPPAADAVVQLAVIAPTAEARLDPVPLIRRLWREHGDGERGKLTGSQRDALHKAEFAARASAETLFYGRIFPQSVRANYHFTREHIPIDLPEHFFRHSVRNGESWVDALVWRPETHSFPQALDLLEANRRHLQRNRQPSATARTARD